MRVKRPALPLSDVANVEKVSDYDDRQRGVSEFTRTDARNRKGTSYGICVGDGMGCCCLCVVEKRERGKRRTVESITC
jgi:hypothetical protein